MTPYFGCGAVTHGVWCDGCQLPCAATFTVYQIDDDGVRALGDVTWCGGCDEWGLSEMTRAE